MQRPAIIFLLSILLFAGSDVYGKISSCPGRNRISGSATDTIKENQVLYNGRLWRNIYFMVQGDQFLFSKEFLPGSVSINGKTFSNIDLKYDIFKDEIITPADTGGIVELNKEMVDSFKISFQNKIYQFISIRQDTSKRSKSYFNVLYIGKSALYLKYNKKIAKLEVEGKYDKFYQESRIYLVKGSIFLRVTGKNELMKILSDNKVLVKDFISKNRLNISEKEPESFIPVIRYYDSISK
jgi:hypothetical protein